MPLARNSETQLTVRQRAHSQSEQRMSQYYRRTHKRWCYHGPGQRCAQSQPIPLSSGLAVIPDEGRLCVQPTVVVEAPRKTCETSDVQVDLVQLSSVVGNASATLSGPSAPQTCQSDPYAGPHGPNGHHTATSTRPV